MKYRFKGEPNLTVNTYVKMGKKKRLKMLFTFDAEGNAEVKEGQFSPDVMGRLISTYSHELLEDAPKPEPKKKRGRKAKKVEEAE